MAYQLACKECGTDISPHQYDAHLGMCPECFAEEADLHDEKFDAGYDDHPPNCPCCGDPEE